MATKDINLFEEVDYHIKDVGYAVNNIELSKDLTQEEHCVYMNIETKEAEQFTIRLNGQGFKVVAHIFNSDDNGSEKYPVAFETIYALLEHISPSYVNSFGNALTAKLENPQSARNNRLDCKL